MILVYADDLLVYDSTLEEYELEGLTVSPGRNVGGTAEIVMPLGHPAYNYFEPYKTIVTIDRADIDGGERFRGRALYPTDNYIGQRTITCEGELCFFRDAISRPYLYQDTPENIFKQLVALYNSQVEDFKHFKVNKVTVTDPNDYVRLESEEAETVLDTINKLLERCGGVIKFRNDMLGERCIDWLESFDSQSNQTIDFGENLLDFTHTGAGTTNLATGLVPYGAKDEETGKRLTIASVNDGVDYILDERAISVRGTIMGTVTWDDVTEPENLLRKAREYLDSAKVFLTSIELTALDLSYLDSDLNTFNVGDLVRVTSKPHNVDEFLEITKITENLLDPSQSSIVLGKEIQSLTVQGVADYQLRLRGSTGVLNTGGAAVTSDERLKNSIETLPEAYLTMFDNLNPVRFKFNNGKSGRFHVGFIAQEVEEAVTAAGLSSMDFGGVVDMNGDGTELGLIYTEFIAILCAKIKGLEQKLAALEK